MVTFFPTFTKNNSGVWDVEKNCAAPPLCPVFFNGRKTVFDRARRTVANFDILFSQDCRPKWRASKTDESRNSTDSSSPCFKIDFFSNSIFSKLAFHDFFVFGYLIVPQSGFRMAYVPYLAIASFDRYEFMKYGITVGERRGLESNGGQFCRRKKIYFHVLKGKLKIRKKVFFHFFVANPL